jgi:hypothetical protein
LAKDKKASIFILPASALRREIKYLEISRKVWAINSLFHLSLVAKLSNGEKNRQKTARRIYCRVEYFPMFPFHGCICKYLPIHSAEYFPMFPFQGCICKYLPIHSAEYFPMFPFQGCISTFLHTVLNIFLCSQDSRDV